VIVRSGTNRTVLLSDRWAFKLPWGQGHSPVRGWLANRSEWRQRLRPDVCRPRWTLGHVVLVMPRAARTAEEMLEHGDQCPPSFRLWIRAVIGCDGESDETKPCSWGWFGHRWLLIDFDRAWDESDRGLVGGLYYWNQERLARRWAQLVVTDPEEG
jgi:hypothetical protein